jgi:hypothetical protein
MTTILFNHLEKTAQVMGQTSKGLLGYDKNDKTFSCEASDLSCAGMNQIPTEFAVKVEASQNTKTFKHAFSKRDGEGELQYYMYKATDNSGIKFMIFND